MSNQEGRHKGERWGEYGDLIPYLKTPRIWRGKVEGEIIGELGARDCEANQLLAPHLIISLRLRLMPMLFALS